METFYNQYKNIMYDKKEENENSWLPSTRYPWRHNKYDENAGFEDGRLPIITFSLSIRNIASNSKMIKKSSRSCPNYFMMANNLTRIQSFVETFGRSLARKNSRYALFTEDENISSETFLDDIKFFKKVLNLAIIGLSQKGDRKIGLDSYVNPPQTERYK